MNYIIKEKLSKRKTAFYKAPSDISEILESEGFCGVYVYTVRKHPILEKIKFDKVYKVLKSCANLTKLKLKIAKNSTVVFQYPFQMAKIVEKECLALKKKNCKTVVYIHDLEMIRRDVYGNYNSKRAEYAETKVLPKFDKIIVHTERMRDYLVNMGFDKNKIFVLEIFDYLAKTPKISKSGGTAGKSLVVAGNLSPIKSGYIYKLIDILDKNRLTLYGVNYECENKNVTYKGAFEPDELPDVLEGSYGIVWDGDSLDTCSGNTGEYLKYNSPHKLSLYLSAGIPVIIWAKAAQADFVSKNYVGIVVDDLNNITEKVDKISEIEYNIMKTNSVKLGNSLRNGFYTKKVLYQEEINDEI